MAMPLYCFNHLFGAILMSFTDLRIYNFISNKMLSLKWLWFYQTLSFDIFWYVCKHQQISVYIVHICMLFILLPCIYSRTLAHVATVTCWLYPTLNKSDLIWSDLILSYLIISYLILSWKATKSSKYGHFKEWSVSWYCAWPTKIQPSIWNLEGIRTITSSPRPGPNLSCKISLGRAKSGRA